MNLVKTLAASVAVSFFFASASAGELNFLNKMGSKGMAVCHILAAENEEQAAATISMMAVAGQVEHNQLDLAWQVWSRYKGMCQPE